MFRDSLPRHNGNPHPPPTCPRPRKLPLRCKPNRAPRSLHDPRRQSTTTSTTPAPAIQCQSLQRPPPLGTPPLRFQPTPRLGQERFPRAQFHLGPRHLLLSINEFHLYLLPLRLLDETHRPYRLRHRSHARPQLALNYHWTDHGKVLESLTTDHYNAIDPAIAFDDAHTPWLTFGSFWDGIQLRRLSAATGLPDPTDTTLYHLASRPKVQGDPHRSPCIIHRGDYYYLMVSIDLCCRGVNSTYHMGHRPLQADHRPLSRQIRHRHAAGAAAPSSSPATPTPRSAARAAASSCTTPPTTAGSSSTIFTMLTTAAAPSYKSAPSPGPPTTGPSPAPPLTDSPK